MSTENFRFYIKVRTALNIQARIIYDELYSVYGDQAPSLRTVERWSKLFREGREELEDEARSGRSITETTSENIEQIRLLINDDPYLTIEELQEQTDLSYVLKIKEFITKQYKRLNKMDRIISIPCNLQEF
jgi:transposase